MVGRICGKHVLDWSGREWSGSIVDGDCESGDENTCRGEWNKKSVKEND